MSNGRQNLNRTVRRSALGGFITGTGAAIGGLLGGPIGIGIGSAIGGLISTSVLSNQIDFNSFDSMLLYNYVSFFTGFRSAPAVIQNDFTPNERTEIMTRSRQFLAETKEFIVNILLQMLAQLRGCKSFEDFKCRVLLPLLEDLIGLGVGHLIRSIFSAVMG